jgi:hypothetical protein
MIQYLAAAGLGWIGAKVFRTDELVGAGLGALLYGAGGMADLPAPIRIPAVWYRGTIDRLVGSIDLVEQDPPTDQDEPPIDDSTAIDVTWTVPELEPEPAPMPWDLP